MQMASGHMSCSAAGQHGLNFHKTVFANEQQHNSQDHLGRLSLAEIHGQGLVQQECFGHADSLSASNSDNNTGSSTSTSTSNSATTMPVFYRHSPTYQSGVHVNLNPAASSVYNLRSWNNWDPQQHQQHQQLQLVQRNQLGQQQPLHQSRHSQHPHQLQQQRHSYVPYSEMKPRSQLNVSAPSFTPASARSAGGGVLAPGSIGTRRSVGPILPSQSQPQIHSSSYSSMRSGTGRRQQLPDLFQTVLKLMRELNRAVSYPELIGTLSLRLQRLPVELKRHIPHILHGAVANGYLRKDGNYYTLLSDQEQKEIMTRNQEAARRAKELEKQPLSWRIR